MKKNTQVLKLIDIVGESLAYFERWQKLNFNMANESLYDRGRANHEQMKNERDKLEIKLCANYKTSQVLAEIEAHFYKVYKK